MIRMAFDGSDDRVALALRLKRPKLIAAETRAMGQSMLELQRRIQQKLSGEVLKSHGGGGGLKGSVRVQPIRTAGDRIQGGVQAGGGLLWWARVHEEGGKKTYDIYPGVVTGKSDKRALAFFPAGSEGAGLMRTAMTKMVFRLGKRRGQLKPEAQGAFGEAGGIVRRHVVHPPLPQRAFMRPSLLELQASIIQRFYRAAAEALR